jgi:hypothetical protein
VADVVAVGGAVGRVGVFGDASEGVEGDGGGGQVPFGAADGGAFEVQEEGVAIVGGHAVAGPRVAMDDAVGESGEQCRSAWTRGGLGFGYIYDQVMAEQASRVTVVGNGDSGGPVFRYAPGDRVEGAGIITAMDVGNGEVACAGVLSGTIRRCVWRMFSTDLTSSLWTTGAALVVVR